MDIYGDFPLLCCPVLQIEALINKEKYTRQIETHCRSSLSLYFSCTWNWFYFDELMFLKKCEICIETTKH